jgi:hypothetical protein
MQHQVIKSFRLLYPLTKLLVAGLFLACNTLAQDTGARRMGRLARDQHR